MISNDLKSKLKFNFPFLWGLSLVGTSFKGYSVSCQRKCFEGWINMTAGKRPSYGNFTIITLLERKDCSEIGIENKVSGRLASSI